MKSSYHVATIEFESALRFRTQLNRLPGNSFHLVLDFSRTGILDLSNPSGSPTPNQSRATVAGSQITWVNGVYEELSTFFKERARRRNWLHSSVVYDALLITVGFPASFAFVYRVNQWLKKIPLKWPDALYIAFYVYVVLVSLYTFRFLFNYARWVFPKLDGPSQSSHSTSAHRFILAGLVTTLIWHLVSFVVKQMMGT